MTGTVKLGTHSSKETGAKESRGKLHVEIVMEKSIYTNNGGVHVRTIEPLDDERNDNLSLSLSEVLANS